MSEMIERVARTISVCDGGDWEANSRKRYRDLARAAIEAMREPTWGMTQRGMKHVTCDHAWSAMVEAALSEKVMEATTQISPRNPSAVLRSSGARERSGRYPPTESLK